MTDGYRWTGNTLGPRLEELRRNYADPHEPLAAIGEVMIGSTQETMQEGGRPDKYKPLSLATLIARAGGIARAFTKKARGRHEYSAASLTTRAAKTMGEAQPLIWTAHLLHSIAARVVGWSVQWGTDLIQAALLNFGGMAGRGHKVHVPGRGFMLPPFDPEWRDIERILTRWAFGEAAA
jgi:phage gpG-like protein